MRWFVLGVLVCAIGVIVWGVFVCVVVVVGLSVLFAAAFAVKFGPAMSAGATV